MEAAPSRARTTPVPTFEDGFGRRHQVVSANQEPVEVLVLKRELTAVPGFEAALRERIDQVAAFQHPAVVRVRGVARLAKTDGGLGVVSDRVDGTRLSELLAVAEHRPLTLDMNAAAALIGQMMTALAALHQELPGVCHGAIAPERLVLTREGRLVIVEHVLGGALRTLSLSPAEFWQQLRVVVPADPAAVLDQQSDVAQAGAVALALLLGRPLGDRYPDRISASSHGAAPLPVRAALELLPDDMSAWLSRALDIDEGERFSSAVEALEALGPVLAKIDRPRAQRAIAAFLGSDQAPALPAAAAAAAIAPPPAPSPVAPPPSPVPSPAPALAMPEAAVAAAQAARPSFEPAFGHVEANDEDYGEEERGVAFRSLAARVELSAAKRFVPTTRGAIAAAAAVFILFATGAVFGARRYFTPAPAAAKGKVAVTTNPVGANVVIDGQQRGHAPLSIELTAGSHVLEVGLDGSSRTVNLSVAPGAQLSEVIELPKVVAATGQLQIVTEPSGAKISVDGQRRGTSPLTLEGLTAGVHMISIEGQTGSVNQEVTITSGATASLVVPLGAPKDVPVSGWIAVASPLEVQLSEKGELLGSNRTDRIMLAAGRHDLEISNAALGFRVTRTVNVTPGQVSNIRIDTPKGSMALNAVPWADVFIDGERVGETPIGNIQLPIGQHEVIFRHPELGEQKYTATVTLTAPARVTADLRRK